VEYTSTTSSRPFLIWGREENVKYPLLISLKTKLLAVKNYPLFVSMRSTYVVDFYLPHH